MHMHTQALERHQLWQLKKAQEESESLAHNILDAAKMLSLHADEAKEKAELEIAKVQEALLQRKYVSFYSMHTWMFIQAGL